MSHEAIAAIWAQLEERSDLATTLRDAVGQYATQTALYGKNLSVSETIRAFNRLITIMRTAFHLQRIYLQSRQPSAIIERFLIEPSLIIEVLGFLLTVQSEYLPDRRNLNPNEEHMLRSIGAVLLAGLRLLTLYKNKVVLPLDLDWISKAELLKSKLADWPLKNRVHRFLIGELCINFLKELSTTAEGPLSGNVKSLCEYHNHHEGEADDGDLPDFYDGLYPPKPELINVASRAMKCISCQCPWWFQSFCKWYDIWSALIGASVQLYRHTIETNGDVSGETLALFVIELIQEVRDCESTCDSVRVATIVETLFTMNPFPQCHGNGCRCFDHFLQHQYQELQYPGIWSQASTEAVDLQLHVAIDLERRKHSLRDADGYIQHIIGNMEESVRNWTQLPEERSLQSGQLRTYIINCPKLHPLTSQILGQLLEDMRQDSAAEAVQRTAQLVQVESLLCPTCEAHSFTQARLVKPLSILDQNLKDAPYLGPNSQESPLKIRKLPDRFKCISASSKSLHSSSSWSLLKPLQGSLSNHSRKDSSENASQGSSKAKLTRMLKSKSSSPRPHISSALFTDGKFVLACTLNRISCYDCELETWSKGHSFTRIMLIAGSSIRYIVVSKEIQTYKMTVFRRDRVSEEEEWSRHFETQPRSIAISQQGHRIALGFESEVQLFDEMTENVEVLRSGCPQKGKTELKIDSQRMSFSLCGNHLVVASRAARQGIIYTIVHDLHPLQRQEQQMSNLRIDSNQPGDFGLSSVVYENVSRTVFICSSAAQEGPWLMNRVDPKNTHKITRKLYDPFPGEQIQCAVAVPGGVPQVAMVNHSNKIFILQCDDDHWKPNKVKVKLEDGRGEIVGADERRSIAAVDGAIRLFWVHGQDGRMLTINTSEFDQEWESPTYQLTKITLPF